MKLILLILSEFKFARKRIGGTWYKVRQLHSSGFAGTTEYWTQNPSRDEDIISKEDYK